MVKAEPKGIAVGLNKGHVVTRIQKKPKNRRPSTRKGVLGKKTLFVRQLIREVCGLTPYEKRILEYLKTNQVKDVKKALKLAKRRLGTHRRAKAKQAEMEEYLRQSKKK